MNWYIVFATMAFVAFEGFVAWMEGTFTRGGYRHVRVPFIEHGGMWGDFFILSFVNGLIVAHLHTRTVVYWEWYWYLLFMLGAVVLTLLAHNCWGSNFSTTGHIWPSHENRHWISDMSLAGILHLVYMTCQLGILAMFIFYPMPSQVIWAVALLLTLFWPFGHVQPGYAEKGVWFDRVTVISSIVYLLAIWGVAATKLMLAKNQSAG